MTNPKIHLRILAGLTLILMLGSAVCCAWWIYQRDIARNDLAEAAKTGAWEKYQAGLRNEWPALDWFIASLILLCFAIAVGAVALLYWTIARRKLKRCDSNSQKRR